VTVNDQTQMVLADMSTRIRDLDERVRLLRERVLLLGKNVIETREESTEEIRELKRTSNQLVEDVTAIKELSKRLVSEIDRYVKRDEMVLVERMLRDFRPLEFMRKKDVEELIERRLARRGD